MSSLTTRKKKNYNQNSSHKHFSEMKNQNELILWQNQRTNKLLVQRKSQVCAQIIYEKNIFGHCMISVLGIDPSILKRGLARNRLEPRIPYL